MQRTDPGRRRFLGTLAAVGAASLLPAGALRGQGGARRIDVHQHFVSPSFHALLNAKNSPAAPIPGLGAWRDYSPARAIGELDRVGIETAMLSITAPGVWFGDAQEARQLAREMNEFAMARMVGDHKGRFGLFAVLPLPDVDGALSEIEYALDTLKADGFGLLTSYGNAWLGDPSFAPVLDELNRRKAVVYVHPTDAACCQGLLPRVPNQMLEYPMDTMRTITSLIVSETATRCPDVRFIFSHAGGPLIGVAGRLLGAEMTADNLAKQRRAELAPASSAALLLRHGRVDESRQHARAEDARRRLADRVRHRRAVRRRRAASPRAPDARVSARTSSRVSSAATRSHCLPRFS